MATNNLRVGELAVERLILGTQTVWDGTPTETTKLGAASLLYDEFNRYANNTSPTVAITGQTWKQYSGPGYVKDGLYDAREGEGAVYLEGVPGTSEITRLGAEWKFDTMGGTRNGAGATLALVTWADSGIAAKGTGRRTRCHVTITRTGISYFVRDVENGGAVVNIGNKGISPALASNVFHTAEVVLSGTTAVITLSNGQVFTFTEPRIAPRSGEIFACLEPYYRADGTDSRVRVARFWADGPRDSSTPPPASAPASPPASTTGKPAVVASTFVGPSTASLTRTLTIPTVQNGDLLILSSAVLDQNTNHSQSAGPAFTAVAAKNSRTGMSSQVWSRVASSADSGKTVTVTCSASFAGVIGLLVVRNVKSVGKVLTANQASGSKTIAVPAFTPSTTTVPLHVVMVGSSADLACKLTPPSNIVTVASNLPTGSGRRSGITYGMNTTPNQAVGTAWTNTGTHFAATWLIHLNI
jgi:hypothetical protein